MSTRRIDMIDFVDGPATRPLVHRDELPACVGACRQGRDACPHPLVCAGIEAPRQQMKRVVDIPLKQPRIQVDPPVLTQVVQRRSSADVVADERVQRALRRVRFFRGPFWWIAVGALVAAAVTVTAAHAADGETAATIAAAADTGTTVAAIATGAGFEANAAMAHPAVFVAMSAVKIAGPRLTRGMEPKARATVLRSWTTLWGAAAVNNIAVLAGLGCPPCLGVAAGVALWIREGQRDPAPVVAPEADAQLALATTPEVMP